VWLIGRTIDLFQLKLLKFAILEINVYETGGGGHSVSYRTAVPSAATYVRGHMKVVTLKQYRMRYMLVRISKQLPCDTVKGGKLSC
jgi:hypothetical protein